VAASFALFAAVAPEFLRLGRHIGDGPARFVAKFFEASLHLLLGMITSISVFLLH
jgi:hypothetical protein